MEEIGGRLGGEVGDNNDNLKLVLVVWAKHENSIAYAQMPAVSTEYIKPTTRGSHERRFPIPHKSTKI